MNSHTSPSTDAATAPFELRCFLFGSSDAGGDDSRRPDSVAFLRERLEATDAVADAGPAMTAAARRLLSDQLASVADGFLDVDVAAAVVAGWRRHRQLLEAGRQTLGTPGLTTVVVLATHRVTAAWKPRVEVAMGTATVGHLTFELSMVLRAEGLHARVTAGRLTGLGGGRCELTVAFSVGGAELARRSTEVDAHLTFPLGNGVPLPVTVPRQDRPEVVVLPDARRASQQ